MKILYGVQCTGNGHINRSREIVCHLKSMGHSVEVILGGRSPKLLKEVEIFEPFVIYRGMTLALSNGEMRHIKTFLEVNWVQFFRDIFKHDVADLDLVICDYEPISAWIAKYHRIPSIGIAHQYAFFYKIPQVKKALSKYILKKFAPVDYPLALHWHHFNQPILPPILPNALHNGPTVIQDKVLVYLPHENIERVKDALNPIRRYQFYIYGNIPHTYDEGHLHYHSHSQKHFLKDLTECKAVICNAGFQLCSEALHLGKKILTKPIIGHIEQESNALALTQLNLGTVMSAFNTNAIQEWLENSLTTPKPQHYPNVAEYIAQWVGSGCWEDYPSLARKIWKIKDK